MKTICLHISVAENRLYYHIGNNRILIVTANSDVNLKHKKLSLSQ